MDAILRTTSWSPPPFSAPCPALQAHSAMRFLTVILAIGLVAGE